MNLYGGSGGGKTVTNASVDIRDHHSWHGLFIACSTLEDDEATGGSIMVALFSSLRDEYW